MTVSTILPTTAWRGYERFHLSNEGPQLICLWGFPSLMSSLCIYHLAAILCPLVCLEFLMSAVLCPMRQTCSDMVCEQGRVAQGQLWRRGQSTSAACPSAMELPPLFSSSLFCTWFFPSSTELVLLAPRSLVLDCCFPCSAALPPISV